MCENYFVFQFKYALTFLTNKHIMCIVDYIRLRNAFFEVMYELVLEGGMLFEKGKGDTGSTARGGA